MKLKSSAYGNGGKIPQKYAKEGVGSNISQPFSWLEVPDGTKSFVLTVLDESANNFIHWQVINIPADVTILDEGSSGNMPQGSEELENDFGRSGYDGLLPPSGSGPHKYITTVYALNVEKIEPPTDSLRSAIEGKVLDLAKLTGIFER
jgi:Raf kinase inhibitor-like YbhB/YbcL family protein